MPHVPDETNAVKDRPKMPQKHSICERNSTFESRRLATCGKERDDDLIQSKNTSWELLHVEMSMYEIPSAYVSTFFKVISCRVLQYFKISSVWAPAQDREMGSSLCVVLAWLCGKGPRPK